MLGGGGVYTCTKCKFTLKDIKNRKNYTEWGGVVSQLGGLYPPPRGEV